MIVRHFVLYKSQPNVNILRLSVYAGGCCDEDETPGLPASPPTKTSGPDRTHDVFLKPKPPCWCAKYPAVLLDRPAPHRSHDGPVYQFLFSLPCGTEAGVAMAWLARAGL